MTDLDIGEYALLSDCHSAALVSRHGSVDWLCLPRFNTPSVFGRLLDRDAGHWTIRPHEDFEVARHYLEHTMVLETQFTTATGVVILTDTLVFVDNARARDRPRRRYILARAIGVTEGSVVFDGAVPTT